MEQEQPFVGAPMPRNAKYFSVTPEVFLDMMQRPQCFVPVTTLPADLTALRCHYDSQSNAFIIMVGSADFEPVPAGEMIPHLPMILRTGPCRGSMLHQEPDNPFVVDPLAKVVNLAISWTKAAMSIGAPKVEEVECIEIGADVMDILQANADRIRLVPGMKIRVVTK